MSKQQNVVVHLLIINLKTKRIMHTEINNALIRSFSPCYNPSEVEIPDNETLSVVDWIQKYRNTVKNKEDILWLVCRSEFMSDRDMRLFAVWCARESFKLFESVDERSINACNVAEKFANSEATEEELAAARAAARAAAWAAARDAARAAARAAQITQLLTYFK